MKNLKVIISFVLGGATGSGITYLILKDKMEKKIDEEVVTFKEEYDAKHGVIREQLAIVEERLKEVEAIDDAKEIDIPDYGEEALAPERINYGDFYEPSDDDDDLMDMEEAVAMVEEVHLSEPDGVVIKEIDFNEFDRNDIFNKVTLTVFKDGFVGMEDDKIVNNIDERVGTDNLLRFIDSSDDTIYYMNTALRTCYELVKSEYTFEEMTGVAPAKAIDADD